MSKKFIFIVGLSLLLAACGTTESDADKQDDNEVSVDASNNEPSDEEENIEDAVYSVGDTVKYRDLELTILSAAFTEPAEYSDPENGRVVTIEVEAHNTGDRKLMVDNTEFAAYSLEGIKFSQYYGYDEMEISESINKDKKAIGKVFFDTTEDNQIEVIYTPSFAYDGEVDIHFILDVAEE